MLAEQKVARITLLFAKHFPHHSSIIASIVRSTVGKMSHVWDKMRHVWDKMSYVWGEMGSVKNLDKFCKVFVQGSPIAS